MMKVKVKNWSVNRKDEQEMECWEPSASFSEDHGGHVSVSLIQGAGVDHRGDRKLRTLTITLTEEQAKEWAAQLYDHIEWFNKCRYERNKEKAK